MATLGDKILAKARRDEGREAPQTSEAPAADEDEIWTPCYSARKSTGGMIRLNFLCGDELCISLPYSSLIDIQFGRVPGQETEWIKFDYTHYWHVSLVGSNLEPIYSRLQNHSVAWVRQGSSHEKVAGQPFIDWINHQKLTDPQVMLASLEHQRKTLLGEV